MGRLSREAGGLGEYSENENDNGAERHEPELEPDDGWPDLSQVPTEPDEDEPA